MDEIIFTRIVRVSVLLLIFWPLSPKLTETLNISVLVMEPFMNIGGFAIWYGKKVISGDLTNTFALQNLPGSVTWVVNGHRWNFFLSCLVLDFLCLLLSQGKKLEMWISVFFGLHVSFDCDLTFPQVCKTQRNPLTALGLEWEIF